jgi:serine/threonine-protein kinase
MALSPGARLGPYEIVAPIGAGGMGEVYRARDPRLGRDVALKVLPDATSGDPERLQRFEQEAKAAGALNHPNLLSVYDVGAHAGAPYLVFELLQGTTLRDLLGPEPLPLRKAIDYGVQIARGLAAAHDKGIVHRDLKPENVFVTEDGGVKILDFGLAKLRPVLDPDAVRFTVETASAITEAGTVLGTVGYMSPEQVSGHPADPRSDIFSFGSVLYEMLTGRRAFTGGTPVEIMNAILKEEPRGLRSTSGTAPTVVERVVRRCLEKRREDRFESARDLALALETALGGAASGVISGSSSGVSIKTLLAQELAERTALMASLGDARGAELIRRYENGIRLSTDHFGGLEVERGVCLFERPIDAVKCALQSQETVRRLAKDEGLALSVRTGIHLGEVVLGEGRVEGLAKATVQRLCELAEANQALLTRAAFDLSRRAAKGDDALDERVVWLAHGPYLMQGLGESVETFEVGLEGLSRLAPPAGDAKAKRAVAAGEEDALGWRPAAGLGVPGRSHWALLERLGEGGFGEVWLAEHDKTKEKRVFKFCFEAERLRGLKREVTLFRILRDALGERDDITRVIDWSFEDPPYFLESEYTGGGSLPDWAAGKGGIRAIPLAVRLELMAQVAEALGAAHSAGVLHKDIKPSNVLVSERPGGAPRAQLTDFGIGLVQDRSLLQGRNFTVAGFTDLAATGERAGTRLYMAPELLEGKPPTALADIYALGVLLYQVVTGDLTRALAPGWERDVEDELLREDIARCAEGRPERRLGAAQQLADSLRGLEKRRAQRTTERRMMARSLWRRHARLWVGLTVLGAVVVVVAVRSAQIAPRTEPGQAVAPPALDRLAGFNGAPSALPRGPSPPSMAPSAAPRGGRVPLDDESAIRDLLEHKPERAPSDPRAVAIAGRVMQALGGTESWKRTRYLRFDFAVEREGKTVVSRAHTWDRWTGRYRLEARTKSGERPRKEGDPYVVLTNINTKEGSVHLKGKRLEGDEEKKYLELAYAIWVNDTYWLLMPYKMRDPGVILAYDGEEKIGDEAWDRVVLTFDNVGLTPKDKYWAYVNRTTGIVDKWEYILNGGPGPAIPWVWKDWTRHGTILLASDRVSQQENARIHFPVLEAPASVPDRVFTSPEPVSAR